MAHAEAPDEVTRHEIAMAAEELLAQPDIDPTSVDSIAAKAQEIADSYTEDGGAGSELFYLMREDNGLRAAVLGLAAAVRAAKRTPPAERTRSQRELLRDHIVHKRAQRPLGRQAVQRLIVR